MTQRIVCVISVLIIAFSCQQPSQKDIGEAVKSSLKASEADTLLSRIYAARDFKPLWVKSGGLKNQAEDYFDDLEHVAYDGLNKDDYIPENKQQLLEEIRQTSDPQVHAALDLAISRSFL